MYRVSSHHSIDTPWTNREPVCVGVVPAGHGTPGVYVTVERNGQLLLRIDAYADHEGCFQEVIVWRSFVVLAWADVVHLIEPASRVVRSIRCGGYFGQLYPTDSRLLVACASELISIDGHGDEVWRRGGLGVDGVVVDRVADGLIFGRGEYDPPGGWREFCLQFDTGTLAAGSSDQ